MKMIRFSLGPHPVTLATPLTIPFPEQEPLTVSDGHEVTVDWRLTPAGARMADDSLLVEAQAGGLRVRLCAATEFIITGTTLTGTFNGNPGQWQPEHKRDMLLLPALELALLPFGLLSLHAAAVAGDGWLALFLGASGSGKSTAATMFRTIHGGDLLADDRVMLTRDTIYGWPANHARPLPGRRLLCVADYSPHHPAAGLVPLTAAQAGEALLAATRFAGLRGLPPADLPGSTTVLAGLMALAGSARAVRAAVNSTDPSLFAGLVP